MKIYYQYIKPYKNETKYDINVHCKFPAHKQVASSEWRLCFNILTAASLPHVYHSSIIATNYDIEFGHM
jgi:hypothetical protein